MNTTNCQHPADKASTETLLMTCPDCGAECSGTQVGDDSCYDESCPLHAMAGEVADGDPAISIGEALAWARSAEAGEYLVRYEDSGLTAEEDPGSRCGYGDDELAEIGKVLGKRGLRLDADDVGLAAAWAATDTEIEVLRSEAGEAGDDAQVNLCDSALRGDNVARAKCAQVIADAAAHS